MKIGKLWPVDATSITEKIAYVAMKCGVPALYLFMQLSAWGIFKNIYQKNVAAAGAGWHVLGFILSVAVVFWTYETIEESNLVLKSNGANITVIVVGTILSLLTYAGFVFNG